MKGTKHIAVTLGCAWKLVIRNGKYCHFCQLLNFRWHIVSRQLKAFGCIFMKSKTTILIWNIWSDIVIDISEMCEPCCIMIGKAKLLVRHKCIVLNIMQKFFLLYLNKKEHISFGMLCGLNGSHQKWMF